MASHEVEPFEEGPDVYTDPWQLVPLAVVALLAGAVTGVLGGAFRWTLLQADNFRNDTIEWAQRWPVVGILIPVVAAAIAVGIARLITRFIPAASGSGVQRVEGAMRGEVPLEQPRIIPAKFVGGVLGIGSGLALGREGPTVQMGASVGSWFGRTLRMRRNQRTVLEGSLAGAGLGVAFNAPLGGMVFVFEEATGRFNIRTLVGVILAGASAITVARWILGNSSEFTAPTAQFDGVIPAVALVAFGLLMGVFGAFYNSTVIWFINVNNRIRALAPEVKAAIVGAAVGAVAWFAPSIVGGGDNLAQEMFTATPALGVIIALLLFRWVLGPLSYSLGTPGGLFSPLLAVGALCGAAYGGLLNLIPGVSVSAAALAFVGMAAMFAGVVRAPVTGAVITAEMALTIEFLIPSLLVSALAVVGASLMRSPPIYNTLLGQLLSQQKEQSRVNKERAFVRAEEARATAEADGEPTDQTADGEPTDQTADGEPTDQTADGEPTDQTADGEPTDQTADGEPTDQTADGEDPPAGRPT